MAQSLIPMTVCPLLYNLSNFISLGPGTSYKFWEVIISESLKEHKEAVKKISMTGLKQKSVLDYFNSA